MSKDKKMDIIRRIESSGLSISKCLPSYKVEQVGCLS